jgi:hypothetical protein
MTAALRVYATRPDRAGDGNAPAPVEHAGVVLNHAVLLAEIVGVDATDALETINAVHALGATSLPQVYDGDDQRVMIDFLDRLLGALDDALDADGRPTESTAGRALSHSDHLQADDAGVLMVTSHAFGVVELREALRDALANFGYAQAHGMLVRTD